ncbi:hypothetical protein C7S18_11155 [Ahniella affigens]|uniref:Dystroglycan-type cadherin-like domain-containing protein n=2 Tax=Ahniella affigens TaxID=2021234 RepID=A0A2P1PSA6_9GAMM|nr:hypothetical protein C7S18_11155 [Ahniella affigens]
MLNRTAMWLIGLAWCTPCLGGTLTNLAMTPAVTTVGTTTQYTVTFRAPSTTFGPNRALRINNAAGAGGNTNFQGATVQSASGGLTLTVGLAAATEIYVYPSAGSPTVAANTTITIVFNGITNPIVTNGNPYALEVGVLDGSAIDTGTAPGNTYTANPAPFVVTPIPDQTNLEEQSGQVVVASNLNTHFSDGDGDPLSFAIQSNSNAAAVTPQIIGNSLRVTPNGFGTATITIRASDGQEGFADDTFMVRAIGFLSSPGVTPGDTIVGRTTSYTLSFTTDTAVSAGDFLAFYTGVGGANQTNSALVSLSGGLSGTKTSGGSTGTVIRIDSGSIAAHTAMTLVLGNLVNPLVAGTSPQYLIEKTDGSQTQDYARLLGTQFFDPPDSVFANSFEDSGLTIWKSVWPTDGSAAAVIWYDPISDRYRIGEEIRAGDDPTLNPWLRAAISTGNLPPN